MIIIEGDYLIKKINMNPYITGMVCILTKDISLPEYVEQNDFRLRGKYLSFIKKIDDSLNDLDNGIQKTYKYKGYNLWWMSTIIEKNMIKSPTISDSIKMLAAEEIIEKILSRTT